MSYGSEITGLWRMKEREGRMEGERGFRGQMTIVEVLQYCSSMSTIKPDPISVIQLTSSLKRVTIGESFVCRKLLSFFVCLCLTII